MDIINNLFEPVKSILVISKTGLKKNKIKSKERSKLICINQIIWA